MVANVITSSDACIFDEDESDIDLLQAVRVTTKITERNTK